MWWKSQRFKPTKLNNIYFAEHEPWTWSRVLWSYIPSIPDYLLLRHQDEQCRWWYCGRGANGCSVLHAANQNWMTSKNWKNAMADHHCQPWIWSFNTISGEVLQSWRHQYGRLGAALLAHHAAVNETKSPQRDTAAIADCDHYEDRAAHRLVMLIFFASICCSWPTDATELINCYLMIFFQVSAMHEWIFIDKLIRYIYRGEEGSVIPLKATHIAVRTWGSP